MDNYVSEAFFKNAHFKRFCKPLVANNDSFRYELLPAALQILRQQIEKNLNQALFFTLIPVLEYDRVHFLGLAATSNILYITYPIGYTW